MKKILIAFGICAAIAVCYFLTPAKVPRAEKVAQKVAMRGQDDPQWQIKVTKSQLRKMQTVLDQPYYYLGRGKQCIAFTSRDGYYVLKLLLQKPLMVKSKFTALPDIFPLTVLKNYKVKMRYKRINALFTSFLVSYNSVPEQTGIIFLHLNHTKNHYKKLLMVDEDGIPSFIDLDATQFIVQKRARLVRPVIAELMWEGKVDEAKARVNQVIDLLCSSAKKGVWDADPGLIRNNNIGFLDTCAIYVDTGKLRMSDAFKQKEHFVKDVERLKPLHRWLEMYYPDLALSFQQRLDQVINDF